MPRVPSQSMTKLAALILKFGGAAGNAEGTYNTSDKVKVLALQLDIAADLLKHKRLTTANLANALAAEGVGLAGMADDQRIKCGTSVIAFGMSLPAGSASMAVTFASDGAFSPWAVAEMSASLSSAYSAYDDCKPLVDEALKPGDQALENLDRNLMDWALEQQRMCM